MGHGYDSLTGMGHPNEAESENPVQVAWPETLTLVAKELRGGGAALDNLGECVRDAQARDLRQIRPIEEGAPVRSAHINRMIDSICGSSQRMERKTEAPQSSARPNR